MDLLTEISERVVPATPAPQLGAARLVVVLVGAALAVGWWPAWRYLRLAITLVHELGHALVGVAVGRRFTGFVLRSDMSGHTLTVGRPTGPGVVATTWAGYPAPAVVGAVVVWLATSGWSSVVLSALVLVLLVALVFVRSGLTALVVVLSLAALGGLWWWREDAVQQHVLVGLGTVLVVGAWRHLATVLGRVDPTSDPGVLGHLTGVPVLLWQASFVLVLLLASWVVVSETLSVLGG